MKDLSETIARLRACIDPAEEFDDLPSFFERVKKLPAELQAQIDIHTPQLNVRLESQVAGTANESVLAEIERFKALIGELTKRRDYVQSVVSKIVAADEKAAREEAARVAAAEAAEQSRLHTIRKAKEAREAAEGTLAAFQGVDAKVKELAETVRHAWEVAIAAGPAVDDREFTRAVDRAFGRLPSILHHHIGFLPTISGTIPADQAVLADYLLPVANGT